MDFDTLFTGTNKRHALGIAQHSAMRPVIAASSSNGSESRSLGIRDNITGSGVEKTPPTILEDEEEDKQSSQAGSMVTIVSVERKIDNENASSSMRELNTALEEAVQPRRRPTPTPTRRRERGRGVALTREQTREIWARGEILRKHRAARKAREARERQMERRWFQIRSERGLAGQWMAEEVRRREKEREAREEEEMAKDDQRWEREQQGMRDIEERIRGMGLSRS